MVETNVFRLLMFILSVMIMGMCILFFFTYPIVKFNDGNVQNEVYNQIMLDEDKTELTAYDVALFYIKAKPRGLVKHY